MYFTQGLHRLGSVQPIVKTSLGPSSFGWMICKIRTPGERGYLKNNSTTLRGIVVFGVALLLSSTVVLSQRAQELPSGATEIIIDVVGFESLEQLCDFSWAIVEAQV